MSFGTVSITRETKASDFVRHLEHGTIMGTKCKGCMTVHFPPKMDCPKCRSSDTEWVRIEGSGRLATYTMVNFGPSGFENDTPYILAVLEFADGLKMLGRLSKDVDESEIGIGMELKVVPIRLSEERITYEFQKGPGMPAE